MYVVDYDDDHRHAYMPVIMVRTQGTYIHIYVPNFLENYINLREKEHAYMLACMLIQVACML